MTSEIKVNTIKDLGGNTVLTSNGSGTISGLPASAISSGTVATARLGSGTASSSTFLAGDSSYKTVSGTTINNNADNRVITGSGTANTLEGEANLTYNGTFLGVGANADQGTGVHIKVSDSGATAWTSANQLIVEKSGDSGITLLNSTSGESFLAYGDSDNNTAGMVSYDHSDNHMELWTGGSEQMRIDSGGSVFFNCTSLGDTHAYFHNTSNDRTVLHLGGSSSDERTVAQFHNSNGNVGYINTSGSSTLFVTSSDYRLKENQVTISDGIARLKQLKPYRFNFKADADTTVDGFFAHEVSSIVPEAISGTKDELEKNEDGTNKLDDEGNTIPRHQGIDQSKLVPLLTSALQEAITKIETLETKVTALENA